MPPDDVIDPALVAPDIADPEPDPEPAPPPQPDPTPEPPKKDHWALRRISEESEKARAAAERASLAERRLAEAEALLARQRAPNDPSTPIPPRQEPVGDRQAEIRAEAARQRYIEDIGEVRSRAFQHFGPSFDDSIRALSATGVTDDFLADVLAVDKPNAHLLLDEIAKNPEQAVNLAGMSSRQRLVELTKMAAKPAPAPTPEPPKSNALAPKKVSAAPPPAPRVTPSAAAPQKDGYADDATDAEFDAQLQERWAKRKRR